MDLAAYAQIEDIAKIAEKNGIVVPRLRGYRLMRDEVGADFSEMLADAEYDCCKYLCQSKPFWKPNAGWYTLDNYTDYLISYFCPNGSVRWDRIHGKKRRILKFEIKKCKKAIKMQRGTFNKYVGRNDVLYIHSRIGGDNWPYYCDKVVYQPWFLEKVDDCFDSTYCDIYAKIEPYDGKVEE